MGDGFYPVWGNIKTFTLLLMSCQYGKCCSTFTWMVSHFCQVIL